MLTASRSFAPASTKTQASPDAPPPHQRVNFEAASVAPNVRRLMTSPTADSAWSAAAGVPAGAGSRPYIRADNAAGVYESGRREMHLSPFVRTPSGDEEEWKNPLATDDAAGRRYSYSYAGDPISPRMTLLHEAGHMADDLAGRSPEESRADNFAQAFDYLSRTARDTTGSGQRLEEIERNYPGTRQMVDMMLTRPVFREHPLQPKPQGVAGALKRMLATGLNR